MPQLTYTPFDTIESAQDFVSVLSDTIKEAKGEIQSDLERELQSPPSRHRDALQIALYSLERLDKHMASSRRILNDLRSLRRLLFAERVFHRVKALSPKPDASVEATPAVIALIPPPKPVGIRPSRVGVPARPAIPA